MITKEKIEANMITKEKIESPVTTAQLPAVIEQPDATRRKFLGGTFAAAGAVAAGAMVLSAPGVNPLPGPPITYAVEVFDLADPSGGWPEFSDNIHSYVTDLSLDAPSPSYDLRQRNPLRVTRRAFRAMVRNNVIDWLPDATETYSIPFYLGRMVIVPSTKLARLMGY